MSICEATVLPVGHLIPPCSDTHEMTTGEREMEGGSGGGSGRDLRQLALYSHWELGAWWEAEVRRGENGVGRLPTPDMPRLRALVDVLKGLHQGHAVALDWAAVRKLGWSGHTLGTGISPVGGWLWHIMGRWWPTAPPPRGTSWRSWLWGTGAAERPPCSWSTPKETSQR